MSYTDKITLTCPICKLDHEATLQRRIDVSEQKDSKEKLLKGEYFHFVCPDCGYTSELHYGSLYVDRDIRELIYLAEEKEAEQSVAEKAAEKSADDLFFWKSGDSLLRIVHSAKDLREKILIFENGLDDRIVEMCKGIALSQFPADDDYYVTDIRYDIVGNQELLRLTCSDETEQYVLDFAGMYQEVYPQVIEALPPLRGGGFTCVDLEYAATLMRGIQEEM
jgi:hypothetical protein